MDIYEMILEALQYQVDCGELTLEEAEEVNDLAYDRYIGEATRYQKELHKLTNEYKNAERKEDWDKIDDIEIRTGKFLGNIDGTGKVPRLYDSLDDKYNYRYQAGEDHKRHKFDLKNFMTYMDEHNKNKKDVSNKEPGLIKNMQGKRYGKSELIDDYKKKYLK